MRLIVTLLALICFCLAFIGCSGENAANKASSSPAPQAKPPGTREPVLVELFTSEGCGNCPPADAQLAFLDEKQPVQSAEVITLGYHVDYFNARGWKDEYSSPVYTERQNRYAKRWSLDSVFTPQMIVDGQTQFIGSDARKATDAITKAAIPTKAKVDVRVNENRVEINIENIPTHGASGVFLAAAENNLISEVKAGSNGGKTLRHISVVRGLAEISPLLANQNSFKTTAEVKPEPKWKVENLKYVVFIQESGSGKVIAVGQGKAK